MREFKYDSLRNMEKSDLHVHLNGAIPKKTVIKHIKEQGIAIPRGFDLNLDLQIRDPVNTLKEYFLPWEVLKLLPRDYHTLFDMVEKAIEKLSKDNIIYVEFRNSPFYISKLNNIPLSEAISWLVNAIDENSIIYNVDARLILSLTRHELKNGQEIELLNAIKASNRSNVIVGVDISGDEEVVLPNHVNRFFLEAKQNYGLYVTIHAGETGNYKNINWAIENCKADRIGHGIAAILSDRTLNLIKERDICLEVCLTSNLMSGNCMEISRHPIKKFLEYNIPFVLCTDNPAVHGLTLSDEYSLFLKHFNRSDIIKHMEISNKKYSFARGGKK